MKPHLEKAHFCAEQLDAIHQTVKQLYGSRWEATYQEFSIPMAEVMKANGETNPIAFVIPIIKRMRADGKDGSIWFAVACEMAHRTKAKEQEGLPA